MTLATFFAINSSHTLSASLFLTLSLSPSLSLSNTHTYPSYWDGTIIHLFHTHTLVHNNMDYVYYICHHN